MKRRIEKYRRAPVGPADPIGCIILGQPFFWDRPDWIPAPADFAKNIVQGKTYAADSATARELWTQVEQRLRANAPTALQEPPHPDGSHEYPISLPPCHRMRVFWPG